MDSLAEYLQGEYLDDAGEIQQIGGRTERLVQVFLDFFQGGWPYELSSGTSPATSTDSHSTNAMILFALTAVTGRVKSGSLVPAIRLRPLELSDDQRARLDTVLQEGIDHLVTVSGASKAEGHVTESPTYGPDDPFTLTWFLEALEAQPHSFKAKLQSGVDPMARVRLAASELVTRTFAAPQRPILELKHNEEAVLHAFPLLRVIHLFKALVQAGQTPAVDPTLIFGALGDRLHLHLSLSEISDSAFDAGELVFSLEGWLLCNSGSPDTSIVDRAFRVLAARQAADPYWRPLRPFKVTPQGLVLLPQSVEIANSLLRICQLLGGARADYFSDNVNLFRRYTRWLESRRFEGHALDGRYFVGWESEHTYVPERVHLWQTSQVLLYLQHYAAMLQQHVARTSLRAARIGVETPLRDDPTYSEDAQWAEWEKNEPLSRSGGHYRVYERIGKAFVASRSATSGEGPSHRPLQSMLLYGPPGTGKSTVAKELARSLDYGFLTITPSDFISAGPDEIEARAKAIFKMLEEQSEFVILFDEIDRLLLDRDSKWYSDQSDLFQLLTPGMLTKLNDLAKKRQSIFVLATNYRERIDPAIKRAGRIDAQYLIMPPDLLQRERILASEKGIPQWGSILESTRQTIGSQTMLFSYTELTDMAKEVVTEHREAAGNKLAEAVREVASRVRPAISLDAYRTRVERDDVSDRKPLEEFAMLVNLMLDAGGRLQAEDQWIRTALDEALKEDVVRDQTVAERLQRELEPET